MAASAVQAHAVDSAVCCSSAWSGPWVLWCPGNTISQCVSLTFAFIYQIFQNLDILRRSLQAVVQHSHVPVSGRILGTVVILEMVHPDPD